MFFGLTIFLSAFLLFQLELISAKQLLPWFGGAPAVWTTCQVFYQVTLLAGYAYAHGLVRAFSARRQQWIHLAVLGAAAAALALATGFGGQPLLAPAAMKPSGVEQPVLQLLKILLLSTALPFFALAATGPLLQSWHGRSAASLDHTYRLYALSNAGSLLGLLAYPFAVERLFDLGTQAWLWAALFAVFAGGCATVAVAAGSAPPTSAPAEAKAAAPFRFTARTWLWLALPAVSSALFLSTTNALCQEVAVIPFLWVIPLAIYLCSFILCFDRPRWYSRSWCAIGAMATGLLIVLRPTAATISIPAQIVVYSLFLGFFCMVCHGELVRLRPAAADLTLFYLLIATGGALGGAFVSLLAPVIFRGFWELPVTMVVGWGVVGTAWWLDRASPLHSGGRRFFVFALFLGALVVTPFVLVRTPLRGVPWVVHHAWSAVLLGAALVAGVATGWVGRSRAALRPLWPRGLLILVAGLTFVVLVRRMNENRGDTVFAARNFFGLVRVIAIKDRLSDDVAAYKLIHGITNHGLQFTDSRWRDIPTTYYSGRSGVGLAARFLESHQPSLNIGVLGLGAGTIASYARRGDSVRFYELDPIVIRLAKKGSPYFTFLADSLGKVSVVPGDARVSMEREAAAGSWGKFDLLALDAFSGDAIPVHLLTAEAFRLYRSHLRNEASVLAIHITNAYLDLEPVIAAAAHEIGMQGVRIDVAGTDSQLPEPSSWILLSGRPAIFGDALFRAADARGLGSREVLFTDRYNNLFRVMK